VWTFKKIFGQKLHGAVFGVFFSSLISRGTQTGRGELLIFGSLKVCAMLYQNSSKAQCTLTNYAARWHQKKTIFLTQRQV